MKTWQRRTLAGAAVVVVLMFAWCVWPRLHSYHYVRQSGWNQLVRVNRITGRADWLLIGEGWMSFDPPEPVLAGADRIDWALGWDEEAEED